MTALRACLWTLIGFLTPVVLSVIFKYLIGFSIGPLVLIYSLVSAISLGAMWGSLMKKKLGLPVAVAVGAFGTCIIFIGLINYFMWITFLFGIKDYDPM